MTRFLLVFVLALTGCQTYDLGPEWSPLNQIVERPSLPFAGDGASSTVGTKVYVVDLDGWLKDFPPGSVEFEAILQHEQVHARRQFRYQGLPGELAKTAWIARFVSDRKFMWEEERLGWFMEITHRQINGRWPSGWTVRIAKALSSRYKTITGKPMVSFDEAKAWIEDVLAGKWKPE